MMRKQTILMVAGLLLAWLLWYTQFLWQPLIPTPVVENNPKVSAPIDFAEEVLIKTAECAALNLSRGAASLDSCNSQGEEIQKLLEAAPNEDEHGVYLCEFERHYYAGLHANRDVYESGELDAMLAENNRLRIEFYENNPQCNNVCEKYPTAAVCNPG